MCKSFHCFALFQRYDIVNGVVEVDGAAKEPTGENAAEGGDSDGMKSEFALPLRDHHSDVVLTSFSAKGVPDFWLTALKTNDVLTEEVIRSVLYF